MVAGNVRAGIFFIAIGLAMILIGAYMLAGMPVEMALIFILGICAGGQVVNGIWIIQR